MSAWVHGARRRRVRRAAAGERQQGLGYPPPPHLIAGTPATPPQTLTLREEGDCASHRASVWGGGGLLPARTSPLTHSRKSPISSIGCAWIASRTCVGVGRGGEEGSWGGWRGNLPVMALGRSALAARRAPHLRAVAEGPHLPRVQTGGRVPQLLLLLPAHRPRLLLALLLAAAAAADRPQHLGEAGHGARPAQATQQRPAPTGAHCRADPPQQLGIAGVRAVTSGAAAAAAASGGGGSMVGVAAMVALSQDVVYVYATHCTGSFL